MRNGCAILIAIFMPGLLAFTAIAAYANPGFFPVWLAVGIMAALNGAFWFGAGRAIYDAYLKVWSSLPLETDEEK